ncbi:unnamed protein product [Thelazia callipaeda]|uniref:ELM2 domain-containing protein n=1 Tax=Thelazia callipaeda TaxID=103827 RepID=A0A0N5D283_THECL|nr:unnamed protein product [Thelazia callipaeda]
MAQNMYRVGDFVYFELSSAAPYQIRKIEELNKKVKFYNSSNFLVISLLANLCFYYFSAICVLCKKLLLFQTQSGNVEAKVSCFYRRRDLPTSLLKVADRAERVDKVINTRRRLVITPSAPSADASDDSSEGVKRNDDESSSDNDVRSTQEIKTDNTSATSNREESNSPKPIVCVDSDEEEMDSQNKIEKQEEPKDREEEPSCEGGYGFAGLPKGAENLSSQNRHILRQHELFLTRQVDSLPATHIRGKCNVTLLSEVETSEMYLYREDAFFYSLVYDPTAMTLLADKGEIRVGEKYQCEVPDDMAPDAVDENKENGNLVIAEEEDDDYDDDDDDDDEPFVATTDREFLVYHPHHSLTDRDIDQFLIVARAVGTFSRALDTSSSMKLPSLHMTAAAASRDVTLFHAMALLHQANYDIGLGVKYLVPPPSKQHYPLDADKTTSHNTVSLGGPILCRDQMEEWSAAEATLFEEAIEKYGKDFSDIRADYLPWKAMRDIVEYYYMWKTTNRYVEIKKNKAVEQESKLKQVYIPNYNKPNPNLVGPPNPSGQSMKGTSPCESCEVDESTHWYAWGPAHLQLRLCSVCWSRWKKYGGLQRVHEYESYDLDGATTQDLIAQSQVLPQKAPTTLSTPSLIGRSSESSACNTSVNDRVVKTRSEVNGRSNSGHVKGRVAALGLSQAQYKLIGGLHPSVVKTRVAFYLNTTLSMRIARRLAPKSLFNIRRSARRPFLPINGHAIKHYCTTRQPFEIIRAAKQIKANKLPDAVVAQLASSIIASNPQLSQTASAVNTHKRHGNDKGGPVVKRSHLQQTVSQPQSAVHLVPAGSTIHSHYHHPTLVPIASTTPGATPPPPALPPSQLTPQTLQAVPQSSQIAAIHSGAHITNAILNRSLSPGKVVCNTVRNQQPHLAHVTNSTMHTFAHESNRPVAAVTPLSIPTSVLVPPTIASVSPALIAATIQQQQQAQRIQAMGTASRIATTTAATTTPPQTQIPQPALLIGIDSAMHDRKIVATTTSTTAPATASTSRIRNTHADSRWSGMDEKLLFLAGPRLKLLRRRISPKKTVRRIALHPCQNSDFVSGQWHNLQGFFI